MKFAKELDRDLVPEWRIKYLNYKAGKKYVKAVSKAIQRAEGGTPALGKRTELPPRTPPSGLFDIVRWDSSNKVPSAQPRDRPDDVNPPRKGLGLGGLKSRPAASRSATQGPSGPSLTTPIAKSPGSSMHYGSFVPTPAATTPYSERGDFALPGPAIKSPLQLDGPALQEPEARLKPFKNRLEPQRSFSMMGSLPQAPGATFPVGPDNASRGRLVRLFSVSPVLRRGSRLDLGTLSLDEVRERELEFFRFMDRELEKIETFYRAQEEKASKRLEIIREQLHEMRNRRSEEVMEAKMKVDQNGSDSYNMTGAAWIDPIKSKLFKPGPNSKALQKMTRTPVMGGQPNDDRRDYVRRSHSDVPYRTAKRKLKLALQEFYRGLELLKSYALLNRTAFRKLNKKYDKAVNARPPYRYVNEKVNKSWFVSSDVLDGHITTVEDLYARYFERGNHKVAAGKLRNLTKGPADASGSTFMNGLMLGVGAVFAIQGVVYGAEILFSADLVLRTQTNYLLQIYAGYFLCWYLFMLFCGCCHIWMRNKVNYPFIFELDPRNRIDWRELAEFPSALLALQGFIVWLNFSQFGNWEAMYIYWPIILIVLTLVLLFLPAPVLYHKSRSWFSYSLYRLFFAGLYPVEFRDFFLGDMFCSLTYATANIELFFCLYAHHWNLPQQCNSNNSRLLGFFSALPPVWRALQCLRRYRDTGNAFPHLANFGKYTFSILSVVMLSNYRITGTSANLSLFITFSTVNSVYCSLWDIFMDASLLQAQSRHFLLRDILALKHQWVYYVFMILDPILRFSWIFYAIFTYDAQHSTFVSFMVAFAEVTRRGMWTVFRVENEHCANVAQYKASRDVPLPYTIEPFVERPSLDSDIGSGGGDSGTLSARTSARTTGAQMPGSGRTAPASTPGLPAEEGTPDDVDQFAATLRQRRAATMGQRSIRRVIAEAHKQDFEKKRKPPEGLRQKDIDDDEHDAPSDEEDDDDDDDADADAASGSVLDDRVDVQEAEDLVKNAQESV